MQLVLVGEREVRGAVYSVLPFQGRVLAGVNNKVMVLRWSPKDAGAGGPSTSTAHASALLGELAQECSHSGHVMALYVAAR